MVFFRTILHVPIPESIIWMFASWRLMRPKKMRNLYVLPMIRFCAFWLDLNVSVCAKKKLAHGQADGR